MRAPLRASAIAVEGEGWYLLAIRNGKANGGVSRELSLPMTRIALSRGAPQTIRVENGPVHLEGAQPLGVRERVTLDFCRPGKPTDNAFVGPFNGRLRDECLNTHWFLSLEDARTKIEAWRQDYNESRLTHRLAG